MGLLVWHGGCATSVALCMVIDLLGGTTASVAVYSSSVSSVSWGASQQLHNRGVIEIAIVGLHPTQEPLLAVALWRCRSSVAVRPATVSRDWRCWQHHHLHFWVAAPLHHLVLWQSGALQSAAVAESCCVERFWVDSAVGWAIEVKRGCSLIGATPKPSSRKEPVQPTRQAPLRLGDLDRPGWRNTSAVDCCWEVNATRSCLVPLRVQKSNTISAMQIFPPMLKYAIDAERILKTV